MQPQNTTWEDLKIVADLRLLILQDTPVPLDHHVKEKSNVVPHRSFFHLWPQTEVQKEGSSVLEILYIDLPCSSGFFAFFYFVLIALSLVGFWPSAISLSISFRLIESVFLLLGRLGRGGKKRIYFFVLGIWLDIPWTGAAQDINTLTKLLCLLFKKDKAFLFVWFGSACIYDICAWTVGRWGMCFAYLLVSGVFGLLRCVTMTAVGGKWGEGGNLEKGGVGLYHEVQASLRL